MKKEEERNIYAVFDEKTIKVYQAYNNEIADEALKLGKFGSKFSLNRMTWIKPSFLWMMYRSGWATKQGQERILAIDLKREGFDEIVKNSVFSSFREVSDLSKEEWKEKLENSEVRCQWDPDRDIYGNPIGRRAIQLGIKGETAFKMELFQKLCFLKKKNILFSYIFSNNRCCKRQRLFFLILKKGSIICVWVKNKKILTYMKYFPYIELYKQGAYF